YSTCTRKQHRNVWTTEKRFPVDSEPTKDLLCVTKKPQNRKLNAPAGNRTRVCTVAGYYSTTRPLVLSLAWV
ncbi:unnamed protein product, partial [Musa hybrid cultivar]